jgi:hypothetical protein
VLQAVLTVVGGIVLAAGSCAGFLATLNFNRDSGINIAFAIGFMLSLAIAAVGVCLVVIRQIMVMRLRRAAALGSPDRAAGSGLPTPVPTAPPLPSAPVPITERGSAWMAFVIAAALLTAAAGFLVLLFVADPNPIAVLFLALAAASSVASLVFFVIAGVRYSRGR